ncbi:MAG: PD40 domain-containing protein [Myxococcales bacterium]|nr:PD40 domain-containing protein [Myxococcales bacterium]
MMQKFGRWVFFVGLFAWAMIAEAWGGTPARLVRHPQLSPSGQQVAFGWRGDLWVASLQGGAARRLTAHKAVDQHPVWSPDGKWIAFASRRFGSFDVFIVPASGGEPRQLTFHSADDVPVAWSRDGRSVVFRTLRDWGIYAKSSLYQVPREGGTPRLFLDVNANDAVFSPDGSRLIFVAGDRRWWRKRYPMPYHRHLWMYTFATKRFERLTFGQTTDAPSWLDAEHIVFRKEDKDVMNLWAMDLRTKKQTQWTQFKTTGLRFANAATGKGQVVLAFWDKLLLYDVAKKSLQPVALIADGDHGLHQERRRVTQGPISEFAVSPQGKEIAVVSRGDLFIVHTKDPEKMALPIAQAPSQEQDVVWSPDGRLLAFVSDRGGRKAIYLAATCEGEKAHLRQFFSCHTTKIDVQRWTPKDALLDEQMPQWSPRGNKIAFVRGQGDLVVRTLAGREVTVVKGWNLLSLSWSPDGRWLYFTRDDDESNTDVFLVHASGRKPPVNISRHPDIDSSPTWSANGRIFAWLSRGIDERFKIHYVFANHGDEQLENKELQREIKRWKKAQKEHGKAQKAYLKKAAVYKAWKKKRHPNVKSKSPVAKPTSRPVARKNTAKKTKHAAKAKRRAKKALAKKSVSKKDKAAHVKQAQRLPRVRVRPKKLAFLLREVGGLPGAEGPDQVVISATGDTFYVAASGRDKGLYAIDLFGKKLKQLHRGSVSAMAWGAKGTLYFLDKKHRLMAFDTKKKKASPVSFQLERRWTIAEAHAQKLKEAWSWLDRWFYDRTFHGIDWKKTYERYRDLVRDTVTSQGIDDVIFMMLGELAASHLGVRSPRGKRVSTPVADLGVSFDATYKGPGLKIAAVRPKSVATYKRQRLRKGEILLAVDGVSLDATTNLYKLLRWRVKRPSLLVVQGRKGEKREVMFVGGTFREAIHQRYDAWVERNRRLVKRWSKGRFAYAHIRSMGLPSLDRFERELFAHAYDKDALVLDVRNNGGGWTTDRILTMFRPKPHAYTVWKGSGKGYPTFRRPFYYWSKPVILLCNERSISNAEIFSHAFKNLKLGVLVGMPTYGGVISTRRVRLSDGSLFGIPLRGWWTLPGKKNMENGPAVPDVIVPMTPEDEQKGRDPQLKRAVQILSKSKR